MGLALGKWAPIRSLHAVGDILGCAADRHLDVRQPCRAWQSMNKRRGPPARAVPGPTRPTRGDPPPRSSSLLIRQLRVLLHHRIVKAVLKDIVDRERLGPHAFPYLKLVIYRQRGGQGPMIGHHMSGRRA